MRLTERSEANRHFWDAIPPVIEGYLARIPEQDRVRTLVQVMGTLVEIGFCGVADAPVGPYTAAEAKELSDSMDHAITEARRVFVQFVESSHAQGEEGAA